MAEINPSDILLQICNAQAACRCLYVIAELGVADAVGETPMTAAEIAEKVGLKADPLDRALRLLASVGVFERSRDGLYSHSPASRLLRSDSNSFMRAFVRMSGDEMRWAAYGDLATVLRTGEPTLKRMWADQAEQPEKNRVFNEAMTGKSLEQIAAVLTVYDFSKFGVVADIGGGRGHVLKAILDATPNVKGVLFDQPHVIAPVTASERMSLHPGDFFQGELPRGDAYLIMDVLHNWDEQDSISILKSMRRAAPEGSKLLVIESLLPDDPGPHWAKMIDIHMMTYLAGRQRTLEEFVALMEAAGFRYERVVHAPRSMSVVEGIAV